MFTVKIKTETLNCYLSMNFKLKKERSVSVTAGSTCLREHGASNYELGVESLYHSDLSLRSFASLTEKQSFYFKRESKVFLFLP